MSTPFPPSHARATDPATSHIAAARASGINLKVLEWLLANGPHTVVEISEQMDIRIDIVSPCMKPLEDAGLVYRAGTKTNPSGNPATLWSAVLPGVTPTPKPKPPKKRKPVSFSCFFPDEIEAMNKKVGGDLEDFTTELNKEILRRLNED